MRLRLTADEEFFQATTAKFLAEFASPEEIRRLRDSETGYDPAYWRRGAELGWTTLLVGEESGGGSLTGRGLEDLLLVAYEFGRHAAPGPLLPTNIVAAALGNQESGGKLLTGLLAGETVASWAHAEPSWGGGFGRVALEIRRDGSDLVLEGVKAPVESAGQASHFLVSGRHDGRLTQVLVPADSRGVRVVPMGSVDLTRRFATVEFEGVRVPAGAVVGEVGGAATAVERQVQQALVILTAEAVGAMQRAFDLTVAWAFDRYAFGRPLASYQALKHRFADMKCWLEASHAISDATGAAVVEQRSDAAKLASSALAYVGQYGSELMQGCVQMHGGIGLTFEHDLHLFVRRHTLNRTLLGTPADHRQLIASIAEQEVPA